jgi:hypothetical protein
MLEEVRDASARAARTAVTLRASRCLSDTSHLRLWTRGQPEGTDATYAVRFRVGGTLTLAAGRTANL